MTVFEALSLVMQSGLFTIAILTLIVTLIVILNEKK